MTKQKNFRFNTETLAMISLLQEQFLYCDTDKDVIEMSLKIACDKYDIDFGDIFQRMAEIELKEK